MCASKENSNSKNKVMATSLLLSLCYVSCSNSEKAFPQRMKVDYPRLSAST